MGKVQFYWAYNPIEKCNDKSQVTYDNIRINPSNRYEGIELPLLFEWIIVEFLANNFLKESSISR